MKKKKTEVFKFVLFFGITAMLVAITAGGSYASSSCVTCHTDEDMLIESLAKVTKKGSAMQSGAG